MTRFGGLETDVFGALLKQHAKTFLRAVFAEPLIQHQESLGKIPREPIPNVLNLLVNKSQRGSKLREVPPRQAPLAAVKCQRRLFRVLWKK